MNNLYIVLLEGKKKPQRRCNYLWNLFSNYLPILGLYLSMSYVQITGTNYLKKVEKL